MALYVLEIGVRGWVYIISNKAMPGLVKIGFSRQDPDLRARELGGTGVPHPYVVDFEVLVVHPRIIERKVHAVLKDVREGKEWFRCSATRAISAIREIVGSNVILEKVRCSIEPDVSTSTIAKPSPQKPTKTSDASLPITFRRTATFAGSCKHCGHQFKVTLTHYDSGAKCPSCFRMNDTSGFKRHDFII